MASSIGTAAEGAPTDPPLLDMIERVQKLVKDCAEGDDPATWRFCLESAHALATPLRTLVEAAHLEHGDLPSLRAALEKLEAALLRYPLPNGRNEPTP